MATVDMRTRDHKTRDHGTREPENQGTTVAGNMRSSAYDNRWNLPLISCGLADIIMNGTL